jgi:hypothetical protein
MATPSKSNDTAATAATPYKSFQELKLRNVELELDIKHMKV